jgi:2-keto-4-pentenoate hydratase/2-oxohepta-3-ene-1,7-dioic acid hydratase in catechol pathway
MRQFGRIAGQAAPKYVEILDGEAHVLADGVTPTGEILKLSEVELLSPVVPTKIVGIGKNYRAHAAEMGGAPPAQPLMFLKPPSSIIATGKTVVLPAISERVDYEAELGVVIGTRAHKVSLKDAMDCVFGYTIVCDVTARDLQQNDGQWTRAKGFDTFCPIGPFITQDIDPRALAIRLRVNGELRQDGSTRDMVFSIAELIVHITQVMTLEPGDVIATGTPDGVGPLKHGDRVVVSIEQLGELEFSVRADSHGKR